jgi:hypothetical protein
MGSPTVWPRSTGRCAKRIHPDTVLSRRLILSDKFLSVNQAKVKLLKGEPLMSILTVSSKDARFVSIRNLLASHPFVTFFVLAFAGSWLFFAPIVLSQDGLGLLPYNVPFWLYVVLFLAASFSGPTVAALVVTAALDGKAGVTHFLHRYGQWQVGWRWYLIFLVGFPALYLIPASFWMGAAPWQALLEQWPTLFTIYLPADATR